jgi:hypothetical protein
LERFSRSFRRFFWHLLGGFPELGDTDRVLDGDLDPFLKAYLLSRRSLAKPV